METEDDACIKRKLDVAGTGKTDFFFGIRSHLLGMEIDCAILCPKNLIFPASNAAAPLFASFVEVRTSFFRIHQDRASIPAIFDGQSIEHAQDAWEACGRESIDRNHPDMLPADPRLDT